MPANSYQKCIQVSLTSGTPKMSSLKRGQENQFRYGHFRVQTAQFSPWIPWQFKIAGQVLSPKCSIVSPIFAVLSLGRSPTSRSHSFPASTHSLAMRAGNAMCEKRCKSMRVPIHGKNRKRFCFAIMTMHDYAITWL